MKRTLAIMLALLLAAPAFAANTQTANVSASIADQLALTMQIRQLDGAGNPTGGDLAPNIPFGTLFNDGINAQRSENAYAVFLAANTSSRAYTIRSAMAQLNNGSGDLPNATLLDIVQAFSPADNSDISGDSFDPDAQEAIGANKLIYTSNGGGATAVIQLVYAIHGGPSPFAGWVGVAPDQQGGTYTTTIVYTLTLS